MSYTHYGKILFSKYLGNCCFVKGIFFKVMILRICEMCFTCALQSAYGVISTLWKQSYKSYNIVYITNELTQEFQNIPPIFGQRSIKTKQNNQNKCSFCTCTCLKRCIQYRICHHYLVKKDIWQQSTVHHTFSEQNQSSLINFCN